MPYGETAEIRNTVADRIRPGCFDANLRTRTKPVPVMLGQSPKRPEAAIALSTCVELPGGLLVVAAVRRGKEGDEFISDVREGYLDGLAVEVADPVRRTTGDGLVELHSARLLAIAAVGVPAFSNARILGVGPDATGRAMNALTTRIPPAPTVNLDPIA